MIKYLSHVSMSTNSLYKVKKFYVTKLNLKIVHRFRNPKNKEIYGFFLSSGSGTYLEFFKTKEKLKGNILRHICFEVKNIFKLKNKFKQKILIKRGKTDNILQFFVKDLEGNIVEFHQRDKLSKFKK